MDLILNMNFLLLMILLGSVFELLLFIQFRKLKRKLRKLRGTGRVPAIEVASRWKLIVQILLVSIPALALYFIG